MVVPSEPRILAVPERYHINYPNKGETFTFLDKETIKMPFHHKAIKPTNFQLLQLTSTAGVYVENAFEKA